MAPAVVAGVLTAGTKVLLPELNLVLVTLSAILILIPGYPVSVGIVELVSNHVVSGMANLMSGLVYLVKQFAGAWLGVGLVSLAWTIPQADAAAPVDPVWLWLGIPLLIVALCVAFQTAPRDFVWAALVCAGAYGGIVVGSALAGGNLGNLFGTIVAVVATNLWAGRTKRPTSIALLPAIVLLVSGSIRFRGPGGHRCRAGRHRRATASPDVRGRLDYWSGLASRKHDCSAKSHALTAGDRLKESDSVFKVCNEN